MTEDDDWSIGDSFHTQVDNFWVTHEAGVYCVTHDNDNDFDLTKNSDEIPVAPHPFALGGRV